MFVDEHTLAVRGGRGGDGCVSFRRESRAPKGGPDGGDGGDGGSVILRASHHLNGLGHLQGVREVKAQAGQPGSGSNRHGRNGTDTYVDVPVGTIVYELLEEAAAPTEHTEEEIDLANAPPEAFTDEGASGEDVEEAPAQTNRAVLVDMNEAGQEFVVAHGGRGGFGNKHFAHATNQTPTEHTDGRPGRQRSLLLEVKLIADVGLVGLPNAGKSTLLSRCTAARPKIGAYPFTTLSPYLGIVELTPDNRFIMADIPGLIEGASQGKGLGHQFLRHVERTRLLVHLIDASEGDAESLKRDHDVIMGELEAHSPALAAKPRLVVINKADVPGATERGAELAALLGVEAPVISGVTGAGLKELLWAIHHKLAELSVEA